jgi:glycosyltransferase involved in cell wall biosynthesis
MHEIDVTVVIAARNEAVHIESAVASVLDQPGVRAEVVVVDDGSTDSTFEIVSRFSASHPNLRLVRNPGSGKNSAFNYGLSLGSGRFACIFAGDDIMPRGSLAQRWEMVRHTSDDRPVVGLCKILTMSANKKFDGHLVPRRPGAGALSGVSPLMNRRALWKMFPVPESLPNEDTWMELAVLHFTDWEIIHSDIVGCAWRVHEGNSINMLSPYDEYNQKITTRLRALSLFHEKHQAELPEQSRRQLEAKVRCEAHRVNGSIVGILTSGVTLVDKLRSLSIVNRRMYEVRRTFFGLLSGW